MSYWYTVDIPLTISTRLNDLCWDHDVSPGIENAQNILNDHFKVFSEKNWDNGPAVEVLPSITVSEHLGVDGIRDAYAPLLPYLDAYDYTFTDEHGKSITLAGGTH